MSSKWFIEIYVKSSYLEDEMNMVTIDRALMDFNNKVHEYETRLGGYDIIDHETDNDYQIVEVEVISDNSEGLVEKMNKSLKEVGLAKYNYKILEVNPESRVTEERFVKEDVASGNDKSEDVGKAVKNIFGKIINRL